MMGIRIRIFKLFCGGKVQVRDCFGSCFDVIMGSLFSSEFVQVVEIFVRLSVLVVCFSVFDVFGCRVVRVLVIVVVKFEESSGEGIRIIVCFVADDLDCDFLLDRFLVEGVGWWFFDIEVVVELLLAVRLLELEVVESVLIDYVIFIIVRFFGDVMFWLEVVGVAVVCFREYLSVGTEVVFLVLMEWILDEEIVC